MVRCSSAQRLLVDRLVLGDAVGAGVFVDHQAPHPLQEPVRADDVLGRPRPRRLERTHRHLVNPQRVGAVVVADLVRRHRVLQALADLAELLDDLDLAVGSVPVELSVAFNDFGGGHVGAA